MSIRLALFALLVLSMATLPLARAAEMQVGYVDAPDGVPLCVAETGNPDGPAILLIHGFSQTYAVFKRQYESDLAKDFRLVAMDVRGHGCSGKPMTEKAYLDSKVWADDIAAVMKAKKLDRPVLFGWSAGGFWIADYVRHYGTGAIAGIVMAGSHAGMIPQPTDPKAVEAMKRMREANANFPPDVEKGIAAGEGFVKVMSMHPLPEDIRKIMFAGTQMLPAYARRLMSARNMQHEDVVPMLRVPVLFVIGEKDVAPPAQMEALAKRLPDARVTVVADAGHSTFAEKPELFNAELRAFTLAAQKKSR